jgi:CheY-like chemotaxis protein
MTTNSKIETLNLFNELIASATAGAGDFPDNLCNYVTNEFDFQAVVLFELLDTKGFKVIGKSSNARKNFLHGSEFTCSHCTLGNDFNQFAIKHDANCELQISEFVIYESCATFDIQLGKRGFLKIAKKNPFTQIDSDTLKSVTQHMASLIRLWDVASGTSTKVSEKPLGGLILEVTNELRTYANSILGTTSILAEDNLSVSQADSVKTIKKNTQSLLTNIKDAIDIAKLEEDSPNYSKNISLATLIEQVIEDVKSRYNNIPLNIEFNIDSGIPAEVNVDDIRLKYILNSLILFSLLSSNEKLVSIKVTSLSNDKLQFILNNNDTTLEKDIIQSIFDPFVVSKKLASAENGFTGLSLTLAQRYITFLNGEVNVKNNSNNGITFNFTLKADLHKTPTKIDFSSLPKPTKERNSILVVEDDYATSKLLSNYLNKWGYSPTIVNTAEQTLTQIGKEKFLAVILDIEIPSVNGLELLKKIREHENAKNVPVIVCSVEPDEQKAYLMGAVEYFVKPINYNYLVEVLTSYKLRKNSNILCVDDDVPTLNLVKQAIETAGFIAVSEHVSAKVMDRIKDMQIDLAIIDLDMPAPNGFELIKLIKSDAKFSKLPIIIYTGKENFDQDLKSIDGLFEDLLSKKSVNIEDLSDTINSMLNRYEEPSPAEEVMKKSDDEIKILFAEDYKHSQIIVTRLLKKNGFENVVVVDNGEEALNNAKKDKFDLILMDMQMPIMNGFESTGHIRELSNYQDTPIIALTAFAMKGDREKCLDAGATDYIPKPIDSKEFIEKVKYYLNATK